MTLEAREGVRRPETAGFKARLHAIAVRVELPQGGGVGRPEAYRPNPRSSAVSPDQGTAAVGEAPSGQELRNHPAQRLPGVPNSRVGHLLPAGRTGRSCERRGAGDNPPLGCPRQRTSRILSPTSPVARTSLWTSFDHLTVAELETFWSDIAVTAARTSTGGPPGVCESLNVEDDTNNTK